MTLLNLFIKVQSVSVTHPSPSRSSLRAARTFASTAACSVRLRHHRSRAARSSRDPPYAPVHNEAEHAPKSAAGYQEAPAPAHPAPAPYAGAPAYAGAPYQQPPAGAGYPPPGQAPPSYPAVCGFACWTVAIVLCCE